MFSGAGIQFSPAPSVDAILFEGASRDITAAGLLLSAGEPSAAELLSAFDVQHRAGAELAALITKWRNECGATNVVRMVQSIVPELACNDRVQDGASTSNFHKQQVAPWMACLHPQMTHTISFLWLSTPLLRQTVGLAHQRPVAERQSTRTWR
jgi:hypothetical protein